ncbi:MAG: pyruvate:ferredoxin (flavodoxin) oxidoreductase [Clostridiaceae bacterium]|jgi:pyruvate-ferredoxin/flavodoxin oxidoreductase|nr:pyruvate:ferredoxin (flavodoxin) oxidoreductase [Clostridiaceae bacterium]
MAKELKKMTMDGNTAAAYTSYAFTEVAGIFPITPSSPMADYTDQWAQQGRKNIFGQTVNVVEMQSEGGASGTVHGSLATGALTTTYTASQGLLLMIPNMYKISGELLPAVFHVSARSLAAQALSIFGDHADVMACRQTGFALLAANGVQEVADLAAVAHLSAIKGRVPFLHFFDGFRTSHEIQKINVIDYDDFAGMVDYDALKEFRKRSLSPNCPVLRGTAQNPDIYFQAREAANPFYLALPAIVQNYMDKINAIRGTDYKLFNYYGAPDAERVIIAMGSAVETAEETVDYLNGKGEKVGLLKVRLYRPFSVEHFLAALPSTVKSVAVLDRTKEPGAHGEPLFMDVCAAYAGDCKAPRIIGGRYGLGSKDTTPDQILAVFKELTKDEPKRQFTIGIIDDVTNLSLPLDESIDVAGEGTFAARFWGLGADGTVGANKNSIKIIGDNTDMYAQAYFSYDSKKSGGVTISDLRFGKTPIRSTYLVNKADFIACHNQSYVDKYDMLTPLKPGGTFLLNTQWKDEELDENLPGLVKRFLAKNKIKFYTIDAVEKAREIGLGGRINTICQAAFFKLANIIPAEKAVELMKKAALKSYGSKGDDIVKMNYAAIDAGVDSVVEVKIPESWATAEDKPVVKKSVPAFISDVVEVMNAQEGDKLPVSAFVDREDGTFPQGTAKYEKRGIAVDIPIWNVDNCIQCNQCSLVCPHAAIRPFLLDEEEARKAPFVTKVGMKGYENYQYRMQVSALDCTGCGTCVATCPAKEKALIMAPLKEHMDEADNWDFAMTVSVKDNPANKKTIKGSQFETPLLEFSGACAGCGETAYAKLLTQLFGDRMQISNATGCSSIWGGSAPSMPYTTNSKGCGPAWANSLFEDNAEHGLGMHLGAKQLRNRVADQLKSLLEKIDDDGVKEAGNTWLEKFDDNDATREVSAALSVALKGYKGSDAAIKAEVDSILEYEDYFMKRSTWIIGGDGWAYDIGYGGLDHVLATGEDVNVLVLDTEVYSNTGGQASKSTPTGAIAQFAAGGKPIKKKDLGMMAMAYGYVYVAQVAMGANQNQLIKAMNEAEAYKGPSIIICYSPCINHGIKTGMGSTQKHEKDAVECGYWQLYRFNPMLKDEGKNPFTLDSKEPAGDFMAFLNSEVRYNSLYKKYPAEKVEAMFEKNKQDAMERYESYKKKAE